MPGIPVNDLQLWYQDQGSGPPLIFLHAFAVSGDMWFPQMAALAAAGYRVLSVDLRGHGRSSAPAGPYTIPQMASDVHALIEALRLERPCVVGLSMGGRVALCLGLDHPDFLQAVVLVSTKSEPALEIETELGNLMDLAQRQGVYQAVARWYERPNYRRLATAAPALVQDLLEAWRAKPSDGFTGAAQAILRMEPLSGRLPEMRPPTLAVAGELDEACHPYVERYGQAIPNCQTAILPGCAHFVNVEQAGRFNAILLDFLEKIQGASRPGQKPARPPATAGS
jgi:3-oxoadipate enol-lactonase